MKSLLLLFVLLALFPIIIISVDASSPRKAMASGWTPIKDPSDPHVVELAQFAVSEHNREAKAELALVRVVRGESQVVAGVNYKLVVDAEEMGDSGGAAAVAAAGEVGRSYEAIVWEKEGSRKLTSFKLLD